jgi:hypothetical protein
LKWTRYETLADFTSKVCFADVIDISKVCLAVTSSKTTAENLTAHFCAIFKGHQRKKQAMSTYHYEKASILYQKKLTQIFIVALPVLLTMVKHKQSQVSWCFSKTFEVTISQ